VNGVNGHFKYKLTSSMFIYNLDYVMPILNRCFYKAQ